MAEVVYMLAKSGDHEIEARELLQSFLGEDAFSGSHVHNAPGVVTIALLDDPSPELVKAFEKRGWQRGDMWQRT